MCGARQATVLTCRLTTRHGMRASSQEAGIRAGPQLEFCARFGRPTAASPRHGSAPYRPDSGHRHAPCWTSQPASPRQRCGPQEAERAKELQEQEARTQAILHADAVAPKAKPGLSLTVVAQDAGQQRIAQLTAAFQAVKEATGAALCSSGAWVTSLCAQRSVLGDESQLTAAFQAVKKATGADTCIPGLELTVIRPQWESLTRSHGAVQGATAWSRFWRSSRRARTPTSAC